MQRKDWPGRSGEYPNCRILRAFYAPYRTLKELYRPFLTADTLLFGDPAELAAWATPDVLLADPSFPSLRPWFPRAELLACPEPGVCGRGGLPARWLEDVACVMSAIGKVIPGNGKMHFSRWLPDGGRRAIL
ncbi:hypothetical protein M5E87_06315 [Flavonifractor plautii]|nr:hypothetical protein M5E87_06315 [Flavonifractor plautii]